MAILLKENTTVLVQGITGREGEKATRAMLDYHTRVVGGVRPGKAGEYVHGVRVYDSVRDAKSDIDKIDVSVIYVPPFAAKDAIMEAIDNDIPQISVIVERIPIRDTSYCLAAAKEKNIIIVGPSSLGYISPTIGRVGVVGGPIEQTNEIYKKGPVGVISRSGGMTNELSWQLAKAGLGQSTVVHVGGDLLMGTTYADLLKMFQDDDETEGVILFGEYGGNYEFEIVDLINSGGYTKPLAVYIGGKFAGLFREGMNIGHAGAIVARGQTAEDKERALRDVGVEIADRYEDLVELIKLKIN